MREQGRRGAGEKRSREKRSRGEEEQRSRGAAPLLLFSFAPLTCLAETNPRAARIE